MIVDAELIFSNAQAVLASVASQNTYDTAGVGVGNPVTNKFGTAAVFGQDIGVPTSEQALELNVNVGTAFVTANAGTLQVQLQAAIDNGANQPGQWETIAETDNYAAAVLTAGQNIAQFKVPRRYPGQGFPRFYRLFYNVTNAFTAGTIGFAGFLTSGENNKSYPSAF